jgi:twitching motility protein PilT
MNAIPRAASQRGFGREVVLAMLQDAARADATDLHFKVPSPPMARVGGGLRILRDHVLTAADTIDVALSLASLAGIEIVLRDEVEFAFGVPKLGRFRATIYRQRGSHAVVVHRVRTQPPSLEDLGAPRELTKSLGRPGLTLVTGPDHVDLLHALVRSYNAIVDGHLVLIENPISFLHSDERAVITHREVGQDTPDFPTAIRCGLRCAADQLVVADIPDASTAEALLAAAESGLAVMAGIRGGWASEARSRFLGQTHVEHRADSAVRLSRVLNPSVSVLGAHLEEVR